MKNAVSVMAALLAMIVPASASPLVPELKPLRECLALIANEVC
ncbi:MAG TPA: hypothetical protein VM073_01250 [Usitatibacter sp.]|nr:hypothetical protein [Usitatibacter sp.]